MAKVSVIAREKKRNKMVAKYKEKRALLQKKRKDLSLSVDERWAAQMSLQKLPRDSSSSRLRSRCYITGRPRGVFHRFGLARTKIREHAMEGNLPGLKKASW